MKKDEENSFWSEGPFIQSIGKEEMKDKTHTFHMNHNEEMNFNKKKINLPLTNIY